MKRLLPVIVVSLSGCAIHSGVIPMDKGNNYVSVQSPQVSFGPPVAQKAEAYKQANEFCTNQHMKMETLELKEVNQVFGRHGSVELTFRCAQ